MLTPRGTKSLADFELNGDKISLKNARTGDTLSLDFIKNKLKGRVSGPVGKPSLVFKRVQ